jgi:hypothetical protein
MDIPSIWCSRRAEIRSDEKGNGHVDKLKEKDVEKKKIRGTVVQSS